MAEPLKHFAIMIRRHGELYNLGTWRVLSGEGYVKPGKQPVWTLRVEMGVCNNSCFFNKGDDSTM
jgi:hypothetical protein